MVDPHTAQHRCRLQGPAVPPGRGRSAPRSRARSPRPETAARPSTARARPAGGRDLEPHEIGHHSCSACAASACCACAVGRGAGGRGGRGRGEGGGEEGKGGGGRVGEAGAAPCRRTRFACADFAARSPEPAVPAERSNTHTSPAPQPSPCPHWLALVGFSGRRALDPWCARGRFERAWSAPGSHAAAPMASAQAGPTCRLSIQPSSSIEPSSLEPR